MQHISDKEFDKLFNEKLSDAEVEPSKDLWVAIEASMEPKRERRLPVYWMAAALACIAVTAGLLFNKEEKIQLRAQKDIVHSVKESLKPSVGLSDSEKIIEDKKLLTVVTKDIVKPEKRIKHQKKLVPETAQVTDARETTPLLAQNKPEQVVKNTEQVKLPEIKKAAGDVFIAQAEPFKNEGDDKEITEHRNGVQNIGDLVNLVVSKIDKREKKFIEFRTDEEEGSSTLASINIGFIKLNTRRHR